MRINLAGHIGQGQIPKEFIEFKAPYLLQTYYDARKWTQKEVNDALNTPKMFLLDSGAFTFMNSGANLNFDKYLEQYAEFIKANDIQHYFELDLDTIIGVDNTKKMTRRLETITGKQCIPVFHKCRGIDAWRGMCKDYGYVAIGASGLTAECKGVKNDDILKRMLDIAHEQGTEVHGLGYTRLSNINNTTVPFDSVDSSSCLSGGRFGTIYKFTGNSLISMSAKGRLKHYTIVNRHNIQEWIKMSNYKDKK